VRRKPTRSNLDPYAPPLPDGVKPTAVRIKCPICGAFLGDMALGTSANWRCRGCGYAVTLGAKDARRTG
jgi:hypothetical protein